MKKRLLSLALCILVAALTLSACGMKKEDVAEAEKSETERTETGSGTEKGSEAETESETEPEAESKTEAETESKTEPETGSEADKETESEAELGTWSEIVPEAGTEMDPEAETATAEGIQDIDTQSAADEIVPGSSQSNAYLVPLNTKVFGTVRGGTFAWFAFTTGDEAGATYNVSFVDETVGSDSIMGHLFDEYGTELEDHAFKYYAESDGVPETINCSDLEPNTTYYVRLEPRQDHQDLEYSLIVKNPADKLTAYKTLGTFSDAVGAIVQDGDTVTGGTNINDALVLPLGARVHGTAPGGQSTWFSFTTGDTAGATYNVTFVDDTPSSDSLMGHLYDEYGTELEDHAIKYYAESDGTPETITSTSLEPDTTYYVEISPRQDDETIAYSIMIKSPDADKQESDLIFETPFEINDTQIQFVAEKDVFIDEEQAKEVLKPVAEAILAHPERSVLLAGTTATDGDQAARVELSNKRAEAVKNLLVTVYQVPESQLKTVGLGFEADPFERGRDRDANGNFVESEGRKNRRVVVLDTEDPVAQEILEKQEQ